MKRWICTVCDYVHEGAQPPETCPLCGAPASDFQLLGEGDDAPTAGVASTHDAPQTLEQVRDLARRRLKGICGVYPSCGGEPNRICQREAYGRPIGFGGAGSGSSFRANYQALAKVRLKTRIVGEHFVPDTRCSFLGQELSMPVLASSIAGPARYNDCMAEVDFCNAAVRGCLEAGTLAFRGDTYFYTDEDHPSLESIDAAEGRGIPVFKPRSQEILLRMFERAERAGCPAVGVDLDGCNATYLVSAGVELFRKTPGELRELVVATSLPVIFKGIMCIEDAEACVEAGARAVGVSNHGGRVLDGTPGVAEVLPAIAQWIGDEVTVTADGGVRTGYDVLKMLALGADAVLIGRDIARAAIGGGAPGVRMQMQRLQEVLCQAMIMTGCPDVASIGPHVLWY